MSLKDNLPQEVVSCIVGEVDKDGSRCCLCNEKKSGKFLKVKGEFDNLEVIGAICSDCVNVMKTKTAKKDIHEHPLKLTFRLGFGCDKCREMYEKCFSFCCLECDFDGCLTCYFDNQLPPDPDFKEIEFEEEKMNFEETLKQNEKLPIFVDFNADWCGPCRRLKPLLEKLAKKNGFVMVSVNVDNNPKLSETYKVQGIPQVNFFLEGKEVDKFVGCDMNKAAEFAQKGVEAKKK